MQAIEMKPTPARILIGFHVQDQVVTIEDRRGSLSNGHKEVTLRKNFQMEYYRIQL